MGDIGERAVLDALLEQHVVDDVEGCLLWNVPLLTQWLLELCWIVRD